MLVCVLMYVYVYTVAHVKSEDNIQEWVLSFCHVCPRD